MKILVAGSEGSLMQWTIKNLVKEGHEVIGIDNQSRYDPEIYGKMKIATDYDYTQADLTDYDVFKKFHDIDAIIQGAAMIYGVKGFHKHPADILSNDLQLHNNICKFAREQQVKRLVYISSSMVYERGEPPHKESQVFELKIPSTDYGLSKVVGERMTMAFHRQYGIDYTVWRPFNIITPYEIAENEEGMSHVFADFIRKIIIENKNPMPIFGDGNQIRCFTWIDDIAKAIAQKSFNDITKNKSYNLANVEPIKMKDLAIKIFEIGKKKEIISDDELKFKQIPIYDDDVKSRIPTTERAEKDIGWEPTVKLDEALERCITNALEVYPR